MSSLLKRPNRHSVILLLSLLALIGGQSEASLRCYVSRAGTLQHWPTLCPPTTRGCVKLVTYDVFDAEIVQKLCGAPEEPNFVYKEGCDTIDVPYKTTKCYCRDELCNDAQRTVVGFAVVISFAAFWWNL